jgi:hypothetical protein
VKYGFVMATGKLKEFSRPGRGTVKIFSAAKNEYDLFFRTIGHNKRHRQTLRKMHKRM